VSGGLEDGLVRETQKAIPFIEAAPRFDASTRALILLALALNLLVIDEKDCFSSV